MPKEYIERSKVVEFIKNYGKDAIDKSGKAIEFVDDIIALVKGVDLIPSADVAEVVRCKDCEYCCISTDPKTNISIQKCGYVGFNPVQSSQVSDDFYCGYGELKELNEK